MNRLLRDVDRASIIKGTALYLAVYTVLNSCVGFGFALMGRFAQTGVYDALLKQMPDDVEVTVSAADFESLGALTLILGIFLLISVPVFAVVAWGLFRRKSWARVGTIIALGFTFVLSLLTFNPRGDTMVWLLISGFGIYLFWTDEGIKPVLSP